MCASLCEGTGGWNVDDFVEGNGSAHGLGWTGGADFAERRDVAAARQCCRPFSEQ